MNDKFPDVPVATLKRRIKESEKYKESYESDWEESKNMYDGRQWVGVEKIAWFQSEPVYNKQFEFTELLRGYLSDNKWGLDISPIAVPSKEMQEAVEMVAKVDGIMDFMWDDQNASNKLAQVLQYMFTYGTGFVKSTFDSQKISKRGLGQAITEVISPFDIYPDPDASNVDDASYIFQRYVKSPRWVIERYPDIAKDVLEAAGMSDYKWAEGQAGQDFGEPDQEKGKKVDIFECWYNDATIIEDELDKMGQPVKKYKNGRYTLMTKDGVVLEDKPSKYTVFPYARFVEILKPNEFFGGCTAIKAIGIQKNINQILRSLMDNGLWLVHGIWVVDAQSEIDPDELSAYGPRDVVVKEIGTDAHRDGGAPLPPHVFEMLEQQVRAYDRVVGIPDVLRGIVPSRQPVQTTQIQQDAGEVRTRERQRRVDEGLEQLANIWYDIIKNHWNDKRTISKKVATGGFEDFDIKKSDFEKWEFALKPIPGSTSKFNIEEMLTRLQKGMEMGIQVPPNFVVKLMNIPGLANAIEEQRKEAEKQAMEMQAQNAQGGGGAPGEAPMGEIPGIGDLSGMESIDVSDEEIYGEGSMPTPEELSMLGVEEQELINAMGASALP